MYQIKTVSFLIGLFSLLAGLYLKENLSGGAKLDHDYLIPTVIAFSNSLNDGFKLFLSNLGFVVHSPVFYILAGKLLKIFGNLDNVKIFYILISSSLPLIFYQILKLKNRDNIYIYLFSLIIFISPYFRSSSIWLLGDNLSLIFLGLSIVFYLKFKKNENLNFCYYSIFFLSLCCYFRYYYIPFYFFYIFIYFKNQNTKNILKIITFSFLISVPAIIYFIYIIQDYEFLRLINLDSGHNIFNYSTNFIILLSILFFYLIPYIIFYINQLIKYYKKNFLTFLLFSFIFLSIYLVDIFIYENLISFNQNNLGGGIVKKIIDKVYFNSQFFLIFIALITSLVLHFLFRNNLKQNYFLLICLFLCFPSNYIFQKYLDPLFYLFIFGLVKSRYIDFILSKMKKLLIPLYLFSTAFILTTYFVYY